MGIIPRTGAFNSAALSLDDKEIQMTASLSEFVLRARDWTAANFKRHREFMF